MAQQFLTANSYFGIIAEATRGTLPSSGTPTYIPITAPQVTPMQTFLRDEALRGSPTLVYDMVQGVRHDEYEFKSYLFADTTPLLLKAVLGSSTVTGTNPYTHTIGLLNAPSTGSQPVSYSIMDFDGANYFTISGAQADSYNMTFGAEAVAEATVKFFGNPYISYTTAPTPFTTPSFSTEHLIPAWSTTITVGGTTFNYISTGELNLARKTQPIFTMGNQAPHTNFAGPLEVTGKFTAVVDSQSDPWSTGNSAQALTRSPETLVLAFTDPNSTDTLTFTMSDVQFADPKRTRGKEFTEIEVSFTAVANTTDAISGYSPVKTVAVNSVSGTY